MFQCFCSYVLRHLCPVHEVNTSYFLVATPPTPGTEPLQTTPHPGPTGLGLSRGLPRGMVTGQNELCIWFIQFFVTMFELGFVGFTVLNYYIVNTSPQHIVNTL